MDNTHRFTTFRYVPTIEYKSDLITGDIVTLRNGDRLLYDATEEEFRDLNESNNNSLLYLFELNEDMTYDGNDKANDIVKVERPGMYDEVYTRKEKPKKMTVAEICKELGYEIEIVKEDK